MPEIGPAQIAALVLALALISVGLTYGKGPWRPRKAGRKKAGAEVTPREHQQFMRPGSAESTTEGEDDA